MNCPKCGESMKKGCVAFECYDRLGLDYHLDWYYDESIEEYGKFPKSLLAKADITFDAKKYKNGVHGLDAYLCEKCGTLTVLPLPEDAENIEYYIKDFE